MKNELKEKLLNRIKTGEVAMRPRWHFVLKAVLAVTGILLLAIALLYLVSFMLFALRETGVVFAPAFGLRGLLFFVTASPLLLVGLVIVFVTTLEILVRKYAFGYRNSLLYSLMALILVVLLGSFAIMQTPMHDRIADLNRSGHIPMVGELYERYSEKRPEGLYVGTVMEIDDSGDEWQLETKDGVVEVELTKQTRLPRGKDVVVGDKVMILAQPDRDNDELTAIGVRFFTGTADDMLPPPPPPPPPLDDDGRIHDDFGTSTKPMMPEDDVTNE